MSHVDELIIFPDNEIRHSLPITGNRKEETKRNTVARETVQRGGATRKQDVKEPNQPRHVLSKFSRLTILLLGKGSLEICCGFHGRLFDPRDRENNLMFNENKYSNLTRTKQREKKRKEDNMKVNIYKWKRGGRQKKMTLEKEENKKKKEGRWDGKARKNRAT